MDCPACTHQVLPNQRFCAACGAALAPAHPPTERYQPTPPDPPSPAAPSVDQARFASGQTLAGRYRILACLGKGGMGEVYRADDLTLGQSVALKFLPRDLAADPDRLARFRNEVKLARQVSHPNVCRVYDIGEADGEPFLTMEYVDGQDLSALLKQVGRLPEDRGIELARQLCLGLQAAHDKGVLHRDLKPGNVMIDGRGNVRLTDFGLAGVIGAIAAEDLRAGTPAYQAPEQLTGKQVSVQSDLYALGLVLYELFTGRKAVKARNRDELLRWHLDGTPGKPSSHVTNLDPAVEKTILRCLERDPSQRPKSALQVLAGLPGGDPLQAALAAGETPSPEMVADGGEEGSLPPWIGALLLVGFVAGLFLLAAARETTMIISKVPLRDKPPEVLRADARRIIENLGYPGTPQPSNWRFFWDYDCIHYLRKFDATPERWRRTASGRLPVVYFWYVQSPDYLAPLAANYPNIPGRVTPADPPLVFPGMTSVYLDVRGRLIGFNRVPPQADEGAAPWPPCTWKAVFAEAGLDLLAFREVPSTWTPETAYDERRTWEGVFPDQPDIPVRVEAAAYHGKLVYFQTIGPWPARQRPVNIIGGGTGSLFGNWILLGVLLLVVAVSLPLAWHNWRTGRGDWRGAGRFVTYVLVVYLLGWLLVADHVPSFFREINLFFGGLGFAVFHASLLGLTYLALEPFVRRRWPWRIVSWTRLLAGRFKDPLVGRDVLIGLCAGVSFGLVAQLGFLIPAWLGWAPDADRFFPGSLRDSGIFRALVSQTDALGEGLPWFAALFLLTVLLRKEAVAATVLGVLVVVSFEPWEADCPWLQTLLFGLNVTGGVLMTMRFGLLPLLTMFCFTDLVGGNPLLLDLSAWYTANMWSGVVASVVFACYGFWISKGSQPLFGKGMFGDD